VTLPARDREYYRSLSVDRLLEEARMTITTELGIALAERLDELHHGFYRGYGAPAMQGEVQCSK
jgi:hypothetical protein